MRPQTSTPSLDLGAKHAGLLRQQHPWIYRDKLPKGLRLEHGAWLEVLAGKERAFGVYDARSAIAVRLFSWQRLPDKAWLYERLHEALALRKFDERTTAYRLVFGENDFLPGITVDRYGDYGVLKAYSSSLDPLCHDIAAALQEMLGLKAVLQKDKQGLTALRGHLPPEQIEVLENGIRFLVNLYDGQKTGLFLDHRDNRAHLGRLCADKTVLNLFAYTGAFSFYALEGGAREVCSVDIAQAAIEDGKMIHALNGFSAPHEFVVEDCYAFLHKCKSAGRSFDVVVLDPPSLGHDSQSRNAMFRAYKKLNRLALSVVRHGGLLLSASCSSQMTPETFRNMLGEAAQESSTRLSIVYEAGHAHDHPVRAGFVEGRYLKCVIARALKTKP